MCGHAKGHIRSCKRFAAFLKRSPDTATREDIRRFQLHLADTGVSICTRNGIMTGVRFLFRVTLRRLELPPRSITCASRRNSAGAQPGRDEAAAGDGQHPQGRVMLSLSYGCGLRAGEVVRLKVKHIDSAQEIIRIEQSKGRKDRNVMLSPEMLALLRQWWKARPTHYDAGMPVQERWLFPSRKPGKPLTTRHLNRLFHEAADAAGIRKA